MSDMEELEGEGAAAAGNDDAAALIVTDTAANDSNESNIPPVAVPVPSNASNTEDWRVQPLWVLLYYVFASCYDLGIV